ncbi:MAG: trimethylamine methyltransferase [Syntrophomonadaceae bacterium]|nr:trimethylamine methyltransferase [Syntrophomonadaceae bacterium]
MEYASKHGDGIAFRTLTLQQLKDIHSASCRILDEVGVIVHHDEAADLLKRGGAYIDSNGRTHVPEAMIKQALHSAPSRITLYNRLGEPAIWMEKSNVHFGAGSDTLVYLDPFTGERRDWTTEEVANAIRVVDALPQLDFVMSMGLLSDVDKRMINRIQYALMLKNSVKPQVVIAEDAPTVADITEMAAAAVGGREKLKNMPHFVLYCEPTSPLQLPFESVDKLLYAAENKIPVNFACGAVEGASTPVTVAGAVAQANAEALCGLVLHQLKNPGAPFLYGFGGSPLDMRTMVACYAVPEVLLLQGCVCDLSRFYSLPSWGYAGCSSSKDFDEQAIAEATMFTVMGALQGCNLMHDVFYIESGRTGSLELLVLMDEVISRARHILKGVNTTPEYLAVDAVKRVGPGGNYLGDAHTAKHFREKWQPTLSDFSTYSSWEAAGAKSMRERIRERLRSIMQEHKPVPLAPEVEEKIDAVIKQAKDRLGI